MERKKFFTTKGAKDAKEKIGLKKNKFGFEIFDFGFVIAVKRLSPRFALWGSGLNGLGMGRRSAVVIG